MTVVAVIPTYRPGSEVLALAQGLRADGIPVVVADDASPCTYDPLFRGIVSGEVASGESVGDQPVRVVRYARNEGIARSLNAGLELASELGAPWLLTVDQDSSLPQGYVAALLEVAQESLLSGLSVGAVGAEVIGDASGDIGYPTRTHASGLLVTEEIMQTGSLWNVAALLSVGGFDRDLGMDAVDAAACLRLREQGMLIAVAPGTSLRHTLGESRQISVLGRSLVVTGHGPQRRTSMMRNRLKLFPAEFAQSPTHAFRTIRRVGVNAVLGATVEGNRWEKAKASIRGLRPRRDR